MPEFRQLQFSPRNRNRNRNRNQFRFTEYAYAKPLKNRKTKNTQKYWTNEDTIPTIPSISNVAINTIFLPFVSARHPHMYDPTTIPAQNSISIQIGMNLFPFNSINYTINYRKHRPSIGDAVSQPFAIESICRSHCAAGRTNESIVTPMAVSM